MTEKLIDINLFGACSVQSVPAGRFEITGAKHKALFALLATAPLGRRTRDFLQQTLWDTTLHETGRQSLRRALADIKQVMGARYASLFSSNNLDIAIDLSRVRLTGHPGAGPFLEGLNIREAGFQHWLTGIRGEPGQLAGLFSRVRPALAPPALPMVAVLPFRGIGHVATDAILGDWLAEEISRSLSRAHFLGVISHLSCRQLRAGTVDMRKVRETLGADYCVTGSLRRQGGTLVLDIDLADTRSGHICLTRQIAADAAHFGESSLEGIAAIVRMIGRAIADDSIAHVRGKALAHIEDHRLVMAGVGLMHRASLRDFTRARELLEEALRRAPFMPEIHAWLGKWFVLCVFNGWSTDVTRDTAQAIDRTSRALDQAPDDAFCLTIDGFARNNLLRQLDVAEQRYDLALDNNPNSALTWLLKGTLCAFRDEGEAAVSAATHARKLSPLDPFGYFYDALNATAHLSAGNFETALGMTRRAMAINNRHLSTLRAQIVALYFLGRHREARADAEQLLRRQPDFTVDHYLKVHPCAEFTLGKQTAIALRGAGIP
jgi:TolB-like protein